MSLYPSYLMVSSKRYKPEQSAPRFRFVWDDELPDYGYKCRTQSPGFIGPDNPPAVLRYAPSIVKEPIGDYRVNLEKDPSWQWRDTIIAINDGDVRDFDYLTGPSRATYNTTGWPKQAYLTMSSNLLNVLEIVGEWIRFETLRPGDWLRARSMTIETHPHLIHRFTCVSWDQSTKTTVRINSTGTPRGDVWFPLVTWEGYAYIPRRYVVRV